MEGIVPIFIPYRGKVYCVSVPNHIIYVRRNGKAVWSGNSSIGFNGRQILTEDWFTNNRVLFAIYFEDQYNMEPFQLPDNKPHYTFNNDLSYGMQNEEVKKLQECLRYDGEFEYPTCTGFFGGYTLKAVKLFQEKYRKDILEPAGLSEPSGVVSTYTRAKLNSLFS